jgi:hypothetical protein
LRGLPRTAASGVPETPSTSSEVTLLELRLQCNAIQALSPSSLTLYRTYRTRAWPSVSYAMLYIIYPLPLHCVTTCTCRQGQQPARPRAGGARPSRARRAARHQPQSTALRGRSPQRHLRGASRALLQVPRGRCARAGEGGGRVSRTEVGRRGVLPASQC